MNDGSLPGRFVTSIAEDAALKISCGFGAGMGLPNIKKCSDQFEIHSEMSVGTRLHCEVLLNQAAPLPDLEEPNEN